MTDPDWHPGAGHWHPHRPAETERTARGFRIYDEFPDRYGWLLRVQESSLASESCVWVFSTRDGRTDGPHLTRDQAMRLIGALEDWLQDTDKMRGPA